MFEDLRKSASESYEEFQNEPVKDFDPYEDGEPDGAAAQRGFLGMTSAQRFILVLMLLFMACVLAGFCLVLTERVYLPIF
jgi:hypothetical protein